MQTDFTSIATNCIRINNHIEMPRYSIGYNLGFHLMLKYA